MFLQRLGIKDIYTEDVKENQKRYGSLMRSILKDAGKGYNF